MKPPLARSVTKHTSAKEVSGGPVSGLSHQAVQKSGVAQSVANHTNAKSQRWPSQWPITPVQKQSAVAQSVAYYTSAEEVSTGAVTPPLKAQEGSAQHSNPRTAQHSTAQHSTAQSGEPVGQAQKRCLPQHSTAQHSTAQHRTAQRSQVSQQGRRSMRGLPQRRQHPQRRRQQRQPLHQCNTAFAQSKSHPPCLSRQIQNRRQAPSAQQTADKGIFTPSASFRHTRFLTLLPYPC